MKRIHFFRKIKPRLDEKEYPVNQEIRALQVVVIDENGQNLGTMPTQEAISLAKERGLDLVAVAPKAVPPVTKITDFGSFKYQKEKAMRKQKAQQKKIELKEIRITPRIGKHDLEIRINQAEKFLKRGDKLNITVILKGRELKHPEFARNIIEDFLKNLSQQVGVKIEDPIKRQGNRFSTLISATAAKLD